MSDPADLGVVEASGLLARRELSAVELAQACLARIRERDGTHSDDGDPGSINAWVRVYEEDALAAAGAGRRAPRARRRGRALRDPDRAQGSLRGRRQAAHRVEPCCSTRCRSESCDVWARLEAEGMVLLGHLHTHEFAAGGTTDQVGNPWALDRSAGGSSGGSAAALAARMVPAATGTDTAGSLRIPSALCGTSTIKPTRGLVSMRGVVPLAPTLDHAGPMARTVADCEPLLAGDDGQPGRRPSAASLAGVRLAVSPRIGDLDPDVADGFDAAARRLPPARRGDRRAAAASSRRSRDRRLGDRSARATCSATTAASTTGASSTGRRSASSSSTPRRPP